MADPLRGMRLRNRILIWSFVPSTIILFAVAVTIYFAYQSVTEDLVVGRNQQLTHLSAGQLSADLSTYADTLTTITRSADMYSGDPARQSAALKRAVNQLLVFDGGVLVLDPPGNVVVVEPEDLSFLGQDWSDQSFYRQIIRSGGAVFSDIISGSQGNLDVIAVGVPILDASGEFQGTLVGLFQVGASSYSAFYGGIIKLRLGNTGNSYLVDSTGRVVYHPDDSRINSDLHTLPAVQQVLKRQVGYLRTRDLNGKDILATYAPVPGTPWGLINEENWGDLLVSSRGYGQFLYLLLGLGVVLPTLVVTYGVRRITDPISRLIAAAREIAEGKYGQQITVKTGDELEELVTQFNRMSSQLQESYAQLEQRVAARTKELATLNAIAAVASRSLDLTEILANALPETVAALEMDCGGAYALDRQGSHLILITQSGFSKKFSPQDETWKLEGSVIEQAALSGKPLIWHINDSPDIPLKSQFVQAGMEQVICVPLLAKSVLVGAFTLAGRTSRPVSLEETSLLESVGQQIGVAIENAHLYEQAAEMAALSERNRLARDLHDAVTQTLFSASLVAEVLPRLWDRNPEVGRQKLNELHLLIRGALSEMRTLLLELRPDTLGDVDLVDLYRHLTNAFTGRTRIPVTIAQEGQFSPPPTVKEAFYRIAQEALNNIAKHAGATQVEIDLVAQEERVEVIIRDDGCGFDISALSPENLGLKIMRERAEAVHAELEIESTPGAGTQIKMCWWVRKENNL
jgi:nitrate/nitrite-specific signal transduction histidine kinase